MRIDRSLEAALRQFNESTAEDRRTLFDPPIPDLTLERLREGFLKQAELYRRAKDVSDCGKTGKDFAKQANCRERGSTTVRSVQSTTRTVNWFDGQIAPCVSTR